VVEAQISQKTHKTRQTNTERKRSNQISLHLAKFHFRTKRITINPKGLRILIKIRDSPEIDLKTRGIGLLLIVVKITTTTTTTTIIRINRIITNPDREVEVKVKQKGVKKIQEKKKETEIIQPRHSQDPQTDLAVGSPSGRQTIAVIEHRCF
jgi:hypothetical protein